MKTFIINLTYKKSLEFVDKYLQEHIKFLDRYYDAKNFLISGRKNPRTGGIIICKFESIDSVNLALKEDPFYIHEIADFEVIEFEPNRGISI